MDLLPKRSSIPISKTPSRQRMHRSLSKSNDGNLNSTSPTELDMFTMLEENIALKEIKETLIYKNVEGNFPNQPPPPPPSVGVIISKMFFFF